MMRSGKMVHLVGLGSVLAVLMLILLIASVRSPDCADEKDAMSSEAGARRPMNLAGSLMEEQLIVKSLRASEDRLYVNEEPFVLTHQTSIVDERGRKLRPGSIWVGWLVEVRYRTGEKSEARVYGPDEKVLVRMRVLKRLQKPEESP
jgi:hypothetical protein